MVLTQFSQIDIYPSSVAPTAMSSETIDFSVVICTYNGANRVPNVLRHLQQQVDLDGLVWEILVVDNNSTDHLIDVVGSFCQEWEGKLTLRYLSEPRQGAAYARQRAIRSAHGKLIGFLDDDNIPAPNWIAAAYRFGQAHPEVGAYGSRVYGQFEVAPPQEFQHLLPFFALTQRGDVPLRYERRRKVLPPGAGLVVRRQAWLDHVPQECILAGPMGNLRIGGEDLEAVSHIQNSHWEVWYNPEMEVFHKIPASRVTREYLLEFFRGIGLSRHVTRMLSCTPWQRPVWFLIYLANDSRRIVAHIFRYRTRLRANLVAACEFQMYVSSLISPFYIWKTQLLKSLSIQTPETNSGSEEAIG